MLDGEIVANDALGRPDFIRLQMRWPGAVHLWAFEPLAFNGRDLRPQPLVKRQGCLQALLDRFDCPAVSLSEPFEDGLALLRVAEARGLEGVVSKRRSAPYRSGECRDWRKVKTVAWRETNKERWRIFDRSAKASEPTAENVLDRHRASAGNRRRNKVRCTAGTSLVSRKEAKRDDVGTVLHKHSAQTAA